jgi:hypothetical protein
VDVERIARILDRIGGGRHAAYRVGESVWADARTRHSFTLVARLLVLVFALGAAAVVEAILQTRAGAGVSGVVWWRLVVIFAIASTLFYFLWRAKLGYWWAYSRLWLFSIVFPCIAVSTCLIPGLYPGWMIAEQLAFSAVLVVVWRVLSAPHLRAGYAHP